MWFLFGSGQSILKGNVEWAVPRKCFILLVSTILWHKRNKPSLKEWRFWYLILNGFVLICAAPFYGALTRPYRGRLTTPSQLKLAEYFPNWAFPKFLNPIILKNKYYWFFVHTRDYKLHFDYDHLLQYCIKITKTTLVL